MWGLIDCVLAEAYCLVLWETCGIKTGRPLQRTLLRGFYKSFNSWGMNSQHKYYFINLMIMILYWFLKVIWNTHGCFIAVFHKYHSVTLRLQTPWTQFPPICSVWPYGLGAGCRGNRADRCDLAMLTLQGSPVHPPHTATVCALVERNSP